MPHEYWNGIPPELQQRLRKLTKEQEIVEELHAYAAEEAQLRNMEAREGAGGRSYESLVPPDWKPKERLKLEDFARQTGLRADSIPWTYRNKQLPPELQARLVARTRYLGHAKEAAVLEEVRRFESDEIQRRLTLAAIQTRRNPLDQTPAMQPILQIQIVRSPSPSAATPTVRGPPNLLSTPNPESETKPER